MIDLKALPAVTFAERDAALILEDIVERYEQAAGKSLPAGDPVRLFLCSIAYEIAYQRSVIDHAAKMNLLAYATGDYLDHLGALLGVSRLQPAAAVTTVRFTLSEEQDSVVLIPEGTLVNDGTADHTFATTEAAQIYAGETTVDVEVRCVKAGTVGNNIAHGEINNLVTPIAYIASVSNVSDTTGGADLESDDSLRERIRMAPEKFSVAGSAGSYEYWARSAHQNIVDVAVVGPVEEPGNVYVYPIMEGGVTPSEEILAQVLAVLDGDKVRPLSDHVFVKAPEVVNYKTELKYFIARDSAAAGASIQAAVKQAVADYELWQKSKLGRDIIPSELIRRVMAAGALRVEVTLPVHTVLKPSQIAIANEPAKVDFGGFEDG